MVNADSPQAEADRRERPRADTSHAPVFGGSSLNPFGDLHTLQHMSARLARSLRGVFDSLLTNGVRSWAEPVSVERFIDYRAERGDDLSAYLPLAIEPGAGNALLVLDARFVLKLLDLYFGGTGETPHHLPSELSASCEAMVLRVAAMIHAPLEAAWEPLTRLAFEPRSVESNPAMLPGLDGEDPVIVTRFGLVEEGEEPVFIDLLYPVAALKPHGAQIMTKVHGRTAEPDPKWRNSLTRSAMGVKFEVRSVLAEPVMSLGRLMELKEGDVIPISFGPQVPVMVANNRLGTGTVGTSNGKAAIRIHRIDRIEEED